MNIGNQDNSTSVCDGSLSGDGGEGSPFLKIQRNIHVRDQTVSLGVSGAADEEPSEHGVASVPLLGVDGRTPSVLGKGAEFFFPFCCGFLVNRGIGNVQAVNGKRIHEHTRKQSFNKEKRCNQCYGTLQHRPMWPREALLQNQINAPASLPGRLCGCDRLVRAEGAGNAERKKGDKSSERCHFDGLDLDMNNTSQSRIRSAEIFLSW